MIGQAGPSAAAAVAVFAALGHYIWGSYRGAAAAFKADRLRLARLENRRGGRRRIRTAAGRFRLCSLTAAGRCGLAVIHNCCRTATGGGGASAGVRLRRVCASTDGGGAPAAGVCRCTAAAGCGRTGRFSRADSGPGLSSRRTRRREQLVGRIAGFIKARVERIEVLCIRVFLGDAQRVAEAYKMDINFR